MVEKTNLFAIMTRTKTYLEEYISSLGRHSKILLQRMTKKSSSFCLQNDQNLTLGPHGCGNVLGRNVHICRRLIWTFILLFGLLYTFNVISINARKYFQFPSSLKPVLSNGNNANDSASANATIHYPSIDWCRLLRVKQFLLGRQCSTP